MIVGKFCKQMLVWNVFLYLRGLSQRRCAQACLANSQCKSWVWYSSGVAAGACSINYENPV